MSSPFHKMQPGKDRRDPLKQMLERKYAQQAAPVDAVDWIEIERLVRDEHIQIRIKGLNEKRVQQYAEIMLAHHGWGPFPEVEAAEDEADPTLLWVGDGFHRLEAADVYNTARAGMYQRGEVDEPLYITHVPTRIIPGGFEGAMQRAELANLEHGLDVTADDKYRIYLRHRDRGEWNWPDVESGMTTRDVGAILGVSHTTISRWEDRRRRAVQKLGAGAPTAEDYARTKRAGSRRSAPKQPPTKLQRKQRIIRDMRKVIEELRALDMGADAQGLERDLDSWIAEWGLD